MRIERFEDVIAWQRARILVSDIYRCALQGPGSRDYGYRDQLSRASLSVMTNIAEGFARRSRTEFKRFLDIARSSAREVQSLLYVGRDLGYISEEQFDELYSRTGMTAGIVTKLMNAIPE